MNPFTSALRFIQHVLAGRVYFRRERIGNVFVDDRGQCFRVFRYMEIDPQPGQSAKPEAVFVPHFHVAGMPWKVNVLFSLIPIPFFAGLPGFRTKCWLVDESTGDFCGYYEWDRVEDAERYASSFAMRFMMARSIPESVWCRVYRAQDAPKAPGPLVLP